MLIVGIAGGTGSGKTTMVKEIVKLLPENKVAIIAQDSYYRDNIHITPAKRQDINFDHPDSVEFELLTQHIKALKQGKTIRQPIYSYLTCTRAEETIGVAPEGVVIVEGILILQNPGLRDLLDVKVFVDADSDERLIRIITRDIEERGRGIDNVFDRYEKTVKPMHLQFVEPTKKYADIIIPQGGNNQVAINILASMIEKNLQ